jgi:hypothetical protein
MIYLFLILFYQIIYKDNSDVVDVDIKYKKRWESKSHYDDQNPRVVEKREPKSRYDDQL